MASTFRFFGPEVGEATAVVDADVTGVSMNGDIELTPQSGGDPIVVEPERLRELVEGDMAYDLANVDETAETWDALADVEEHYHAASEKYKDALLTAAEILFCGYD